ncbi:MAG: MFS transporter [Anaerolineae bacterium]|nr:MFS transporter [Anaerolineae bacterium]
MRRSKSFHSRFAAFFALFFMGNGIFFPYLNAFLIHRGLTGTQLGLLLGAISLTGIFAQPVWSYLGDLSHGRKHVLTLASATAAVAAIGFLVSHTFGWLFFVSIVYAILRAPIMALGTAVTFDYLEQHQQLDRFGPLRAWGSAGFAVSALIGGNLLAAPFINWLPAIHAALWLGLALLTMTLPETTAHGSTAWLEGVQLLPQRPRLAMLFLGALLISGPLIIGVQYLSMFMETLGAPGWLIGLAVSSMAIIEVPLMQQTPNLVARFGERAVLIVAFALTPLRWFLFANVQAAWLLVPLQALHSAAMTALLVIVPKQVDEQLPPRWRATGQGLYTTAILGIGPSLGQFAAGALFESHGFRTVWLLCMVAATVGTLIVGLTLRQRTVQQSAEEPQ